MHKHSHSWPSNNKALPKIKNDSELIFAAECLPNFYNNFFKDFISDKTVILLCPKNDSDKDCLNKIYQALSNKSPKTITICKIKLKCCDNLTNLVQQGLKITKKELKITEKIYDKNGNLISYH